jgi:hypothetical protein
MAKSTFRMNVSQDSAVAPTTPVDCVVEDTPLGVVANVGCQAAGIMTATGAERLAAELVAAAKRSKDTPKGGPHFEVTFGNGNARDLGPYKALEYLEETDELECEYADNSPKAGQKRRYDAAIVDKMYAVEK